MKHYFYIFGCVIITLFALMVTCSAQSNIFIDGRKLPRSELNKYFPIVHPYDDGSYYYIDNLVEGKPILPKYKNFEGDRTRIIVTDFEYIAKKNDLTILFGNMMGGRTGIILGIIDSSGHKQLKIAEQGPAIASVNTQNIDLKTFYEVKYLSGYAGMFGYSNQAYAVFVDSGNYCGLAFDTYLAESIGAANDVKYVKGSSYQQFVVLRKRGDDIVVEVKKTDSSKVTSDTSFVFRSLKFIK